MQLWLHQRALSAFETDSFTKHQALVWLNAQHLSEGEQQIQRDRATKVRRFNGAHMRTTDPNLFGQLLLRESGVFPVVGDVVAQLDVFLRVIKSIFIFRVHFYSPYLILDG